MRLAKCECNRCNLEFLLNIEMNQERSTYMCPGCGSSDIRFTWINGDM